MSGTRMDGTGTRTRHPAIPFAPFIAYPVMS